MSTGILKVKLIARELVVGSYAFLASPDSAEIMALAGADFVVIDLQHSPKDWLTLGTMIRAVQIRGSSAVVRLSGVRSADIGRVLDLAPDGLMVPGVSSVADVQEVVRSAYFGPVGERDTCSMTRATQYGAGPVGLSGMAEELNRNLAIMGIVEDADAISNIEQIVGASPGLHSIQIGRSDLAASLGIPGQLDDEAVVSRVKRAMECIRQESSVSFGALLYQDSDAPRWRAEGANVLIYQSDVGILSREYKRAFEHLRSASAMP